MPKGKSTAPIELIVEGIKKDTEFIVRELKDIEQFQRTCSAKQNDRHTALQQADSKQNEDIAVMKRDVEVAHVRIDSKADDKSITDALKSLSVKFWFIVSAIILIAIFVIREGLIK